MTSDALVRLPSCSQLVAEVEALTGVSLSIDPAMLENGDSYEELKKILANPPRWPTPPLKIYVFQNLDTMTLNNGALEELEVEVHEDEIPALVPADDETEVEESTDADFKYHRDFKYLSYAMGAPPFVLVPEFRDYSMSRGKVNSRLAEAFFPRPFTSFTPKEERVDATLPKERCSEECLYHAACLINSHIEQRAHRQHKIRSDKHIGKEQVLFTPHADHVPPSPFTIEFEAVEPCPFSRGVALTDIRALKQVSMLGANDTVFDDSPEGSENVTLLVQFGGREKWMVPLPVGCDCGEMTRAALALIIADVVYDYHQEFDLGKIYHLRLCSLSVSPDLEYWYPTFAEVRKRCAE